mgnify:CR=1 FL=1
MPPGLSRSRIFGSGECVWPTCSITGSGPAAWRARRSASRSRSPATLARQPDLDADDPVAVLRHRAARPGRRPRPSMFNSSFGRGEAGSSDVQEGAARGSARRCARRDERVDVVGAGRSAVDHRRDAVAHERRRRQVRADVDVEIDQTGRDDLPRASTSSPASAAAMFGWTARMRPPSIATSATRSTRLDGSITRPPLITRS